MMENNGNESKVLPRRLIHAQIVTCPQCGSKMVFSVMDKGSSIPCSVDECGGEIKIQPLIQPDLNHILM